MPHSYSMVLQLLASILSIPVSSSPLPSTLERRKGGGGGGRSGGGGSRSGGKGRSGVRGSGGVVFVSGGVIAGIVIGSIVGVILIALLIWYIRVRRLKKMDHFDVSAQSSLYHKEGHQEEDHQEEGHREGHTMDISAPLPPKAPAYT